MSDIISFKDKHSYLSNFYDFGKLGYALTSELDESSHKFYTTESLYQCLKSETPNFALFSVLNPYHSKQTGKTVKLRPEWNQIKHRVMSELVDKKFDIPILSKMLLETANSNLIEGNLHHDNFFGACSCIKCSESIIPKMNILGKLLMSKRTYIKVNSGLLHNDTYKIRLIKL